MKDYGKICMALTSLLKKDALTWDTQADQAFSQLKPVMTTPATSFGPSLLRLMLQGSSSYVPP